MNRRIGAALTVCAMVGCVVPAVAIPIAHGRLLGLFGPDLGAAVAFSLVGAVLLLRGAVLNIAVIVCVQGIAASATTLLGVLAQLGPAHGPVTDVQLWAGYLNDFAWLPGVVLLTPLVLLFPNGRLASPRWRWPILMVAAAASVFVVIGLVGKVPVVDGRTYADAPSPTGFIDFPTVAQNVLGTLIFALFIAGLFVSIGSVVARRRRAVGVERAQLTSLLFGASISVALIASLNLTDTYNVVIFPLELFAVAPVALGIGVAVLRYRLYDIDKIVSRTVSYALVLIVLGGVYVGVVVGIADVVPHGNGPVWVAVATLLVSILVVPLTRRVRHAVDRRFNRSRFDAEQVASAFAARLRARPERGDVPSDLLEVVHRTVAPTHAGVWLIRD